MRRSLARPLFHSLLFAAPTLLTTYLMFMFLSWSRDALDGRERRITLTDASIYFLLQEVLLPLFVLCLTLLPFVIRTSRDLAACEDRIRRLEEELGRRHSGETARSEEAVGQPH